MLTQPQPSPSRRVGQLRFVRWIVENYGQDRESLGGYDERERVTFALMMDLVFIQ